jgi:hypothetical protein
MAATVVTANYLADHSVSPGFEDVFSHPAWFVGRRIRRFDRSETSESQIAAITKRSVATEEVTVLRPRSFSLEPPRSGRFLRPQVGPHPVARGARGRNQLRAVLGRPVGQRFRRRQISIVFIGLFAAIYLANFTFFESKYFCDCRRARDCGVINSSNTPPGGPLVGTPSPSGHISSLTSFEGTLGTLGVLLGFLGAP